MALDTAVKRASAINVTAPWRGLLPFPDGTIDQGDRQATAYQYSGILAGGGSPAASDAFFHWRYRRKSWR